MKFITLYILLVILSNSLLICKSLKFSYLYRNKLLTKGLKPTQTFAVKGKWDPPVQSPEGEYIADTTDIVYEVELSKTAGINWGKLIIYLLELSLVVGFN